MSTLKMNGSEYQIEPNTPIEHQIWLSLNPTEKYEIIQKIGLECLSKRFFKKCLGVIKENLDDYSQKVSWPTTFKAWMTESFTTDYLKDIAHYGCVNGFPGLTYYSETTELYQKYNAEIWEMLYEDAADFGVSILDFVASFNGSKGACDERTFFNLLVWYAAERIAREEAEHEEDGEQGN